MLLVGQPEAELGKVVGDAETAAQQCKTLVREGSSTACPKFDSSTPIAPFLKAVNTTWLAPSSPKNRKFTYGGKRWLIAIDDAQFLTPQKVQGKEQAEVFQIKFSKTEVVDLPQRTQCWYNAKSRRVKPSVQGKAGKSFEYELKKIHITHVHPQ